MEKVIKEQDLELFNQLIDSHENILVCGHVSPDGDCIGSTLVLYNWLSRKGKHPTVVVPNYFPDNLAWLPGADSIIVGTKDPAAAKNAFEAAELIIIADLNAANRLAQLEEHLNDSKAPRILIDHHLNPEYFCDITISCSHMCAAAEVICHMLWQLQELDSITHDEAVCLYAGMMCDTGAFSFASSRPVIYECISRLLAKGIDKDKIYRNVFWTASEARLRLQAFLIYVNMTVLREYHASIITLTNAERKRFNVKNGDTDGVVNKPLEMAGHRLSIFINEDTEHPGTMKLSLRSVGDFPCDEMASRFFNGGGHKNASGGRLVCSMDEALDKVKEAIYAYGKLLK